MDTTLIRIGKGITGERMGSNSIGAVEVASKEEDKWFLESIDTDSKGIANKSNVCFLSLKPNKII